jgi:hypothetical protein
MTDKPIKTNTKNKVEKPVAADSKTKITKPIKTTAASKVEKPIKVASAPKIDKSIKVETPKTPVKIEKKALAIKSEKADMLDKEASPKKKRISKGLATYNRRVKQEKRSQDL